MEGEIVKRDLAGVYGIFCGPGGEKRSATPAKKREKERGGRLLRNAGSGHFHFVC